MNSFVATDSTATYERISRELAAYLKENLSAPRYEHSLSTARMCKTLCERFSYDPPRGFVAGLGHDIARELPGKYLLEVSEKNGFVVHAIERDRPVLLHGKIGASILREKFGIFDEEILEAVRNHTLGSPGLGKLGKILYAADYCEPTRKYVDEAFLREFDGLSLDSMVLRILAHEKKRRKALAPITQAMYHELEGIFGEE